MDSSLTGSWIGGYRLLRPLGTGGTATVWQAEDQERNRVALKLLHPAQASTEQSRVRLQREARLVNQIPGHGIARVLDFESEDTTPFVVTELIVGPTLAEIVAEAPLTVEECLYLALQLREIITRVHKSGIVHRDLKPSNVILSDDGPVLIDFGLAQSADDPRLTQTGKVTGTPGYVSPEILSATTDVSFEVWQEGDWWALTILLLNSLTGRPPFGEGNLEAVFHRLFQRQADMEGLSPTLAREFATSLSTSPGARLNIGNLLRAMRQAVDETAESGTEILTAELPGVAFDRTSVYPVNSNDNPGREQLEDSIIVHENFVSFAKLSDPNFSNPVQEDFPWQVAALSPYEKKRIPNAPITGFVLAAAMGLIPVFTGSIGFGVAMGLMALLSVFGSAHAWREKRRQRYGEIRGSDSTMMTLMIPRHLLWGMMQIAPGVLLGTILGVALWVVLGMSVGIPEPWSHLSRWLSVGFQSGSGISLLAEWVVSTVVILGVTFVPTSSFLRQAESLIAQKLLPSKLLRVLAGLLVCAGIGGVLISMG